MTEQNTLEKPISGLFKYLEPILERGRKRFLSRKTTELNKQRWARIICQAVETYAKILEIRKIEDLEKRIVVLENEVGR